MDWTDPQHYNFEASVYWNKNKDEHSKKLGKLIGNLQPYHSVVQALMPSYVTDTTFYPGHAPLLTHLLRIHNITEDQFSKDLKHQDQAMSIISVLRESFEVIKILEAPTAWKNWDTAALKYVQHTIIISELINHSTWIEKELTIGKFRMLADLLQLDSLMVCFPLPLVCFFIHPISECAFY